MSNMTEAPASARKDEIVLLKEELLHPVYLMGHLKELAEKIGLKEDYLKKALMTQEVFLFCKRKDGKYVNETPTVFEDEEEGYKAYLTEKDGNREMVIGESAVQALYEMTGIEPIKSVEITDNMFRFCDADTWWDFTIMMKLLKQRNERYDHLIKLGAPDIIIRNAYRLIVEGVQELENNALWVYPNEPLQNAEKRRRRPSGYICRSFDSIGYSLVSGWSDEMKKRFELEEEFA